MLDPCANMPITMSAPMNSLYQIWCLELETAFTIQHVLHHVNATYQISARKSGASIDLSRDSAQSRFPSVAEMAHGLSSLPGTYSRALGRTRWAYHLQGQLSSIFLVPDGNVVARTSCRR